MEEETTTDEPLMLSDGQYNLAKKLVQIWLPAFSALYFGLAAIWGLPAAEQVVGTIAVITTFLGVTLNVSSNRYEASGKGNVGNVVVTITEEGIKVVRLDLTKDPDAFDQPGAISFNVVHE